MTDDDVVVIGGSDWHPEEKPGSQKKWKWAILNPILLAAAVIILVLSILLISLDNFSAETNITAVLACFNNIGPGMDMVGPTCNYAGFSVLSKLVLIIDMLAGRLEIFPILVLLSRGTWKQR